MPKPSNLSSMSVDQLLKLRSDVEQVLTRRATQLRNDLSKLSRQSPQEVAKLQSNSEISQGILGPDVVRNQYGYGRNLRVVRSWPILQSINPTNAVELNAN